MRLSPPLLLVLSLSLLGAGAVAAGAYRWVDENGVTHYSQVPPPDKAATRIAPPPPPPAGSGQTTWDKLDVRLQNAELRKEEQQKQRQEEQKSAEKQAARQKNCNAARRNLEILQGSPRRMIRLPNGEYRRLTAEEREEQMARARERIDEFCDD